MGGIAVRPVFHIFTTLWVNVSYLLYTYNGCFATLPVKPHCNLLLLFLNNKNVKCSYSAWIRFSFVIHKFIYEIWKQQWRNLFKFRNKDSPLQRFTLCVIKFKFIRFFCPFIGRWKRVDFHSVEFSSCLSRRILGWYY